MFSAMRKALFGTWHYAALAAVVAAVMFAVAVWFPNLRLLFSILSNPLVSLADKVMLPINLLGSITTNFTLLSASYTIAIALLSGINVTLITYQIRKRGLSFSRSGSMGSVAGLVSGVFGLGCAACNSLIIMSLLGTTAGAGLIAVLPLKGGEFGIAGVALMLVSLYFIVKSIKTPPVCEV